MRENLLLLKDLLEHQKKKKFKCMSTISKTVYIDTLGDIFDKKNRTYQRTLKMKPISAKACTRLDFYVENNNKDPKFKVDDHVAISKYRTFLQNFTVQIDQKKFQLKILHHGRMQQRTSLEKNLLWRR